MIFIIIVFGWQLRGGSAAKFFENFGIASGVCGRRVGRFFYKEQGALVDLGAFLARKRIIDDTRLSVGTEPLQKIRFLNLGQFFLRTYRLHGKEPPPLSHKGQAKLAQYGQRGHGTGGYNVKVLT